MPRSRRGAISIVSDGYGQSRVHRFAPDGTLITSWGAEGVSRANFIYRTMSEWMRGGASSFRIARTPASKSSTATVHSSWNGRMLPARRTSFLIKDNVLYVTEVPQRVSIFNLDGELLARWGETGRRARSVPRFAAWPRGRFARRSATSPKSPGVPDSRSSPASNNRRSQNDGKRNHQYCPEGTRKEHQEHQEEHLICHLVLLVFLVSWWF